MGKFIISESEKNRIRLLYEDNEPLPQPSQFVKDLSSQLGLTTNILIALDWSLYKNDQKKINQLSSLFANIKQPINDAIGKIKSDPNKLRIVSGYLNNYKTGSLSSEQTQFLNDLKKKLSVTTTQQTTTQQTTTQNPYGNYKLKSSGNPVSGPAKPTLARYTDI
jgi:hypothetical protein